MKHADMRNTCRQLTLLQNIIWSEICNQKFNLTPIQHYSVKLWPQREHQNQQVNNFLHNQARAVYMILKLVFSVLHVWHLSLMIHFKYESELLSQLLLQELFFCSHQFCKRQNIFLSYHFSTNCSYRHTGRRQGNSDRDSENDLGCVLQSFNGKVSFYSQLINSNVAFFLRKTLNTTKFIYTSSP